METKRITFAQMKYDVIIAGGGIVGLATALQILKNRPDAKVTVLEKENKVAAHQSSRNSGVIIRVFTTSQGACVPLTAGSDTT